MTHRGLLLLVAPFLVIGCQKNVETPFADFPDGLEPLEDCSAGLPADQGTEDFKSAAGEDDDWMFAHVCGYITASVDDVWTAMQDGDVVTDWRRVDEWEVTATGQEPDFDVSFKVHHLVDDLITVEYDIDWLESVWEENEDGTVDSVVARFQKVEGSSLIELIEGSVVVDTVQTAAEGQDVVSIEIVYHHQSLGYNEEDLLLKSEDLFESIAAAASGQALPTYDE